MNATHAVALTGGSAVMDALTTLMTGWHGMDTSHAAAASFLIVMVCGSVYAGLQWLVHWKWPSAPVAQ